MERNNTEKLCDALERCLISPNVSDSNMEAANLVDVVERAARNLNKIAKSITPQNAAPMKTPDGGHIESLSESVIYMAVNLGHIAEAIGDLAQAVRESKG